MDCININNVSKQWPLKELYNMPFIHPFKQPFTHQQGWDPCKATASSWGAAAARPAQVHFDTLARKGWGSF